MSEAEVTRTSKKNKGIKAAAKIKRRAEAEARNALYQKKSAAEKLQTAGPRERARLEAKTQ